MPHISFKIKAESISTFGTNGLITYQYYHVIKQNISAFLLIRG